jgi:ABC transporter substrate binding protein
VAAGLALLGDLDAVIVRQRLAELGYVEGKNLIFDFRSAEGQPERLPQLAAELVKTNPDVIVAGFGTATAKAAQAATATVPVVFTTVGDPIGSGIVKSLSLSAQTRPFLLLLPALLLCRLTRCIPSIARCLLLGSYSSLLFGFQVCRFLGCLNCRSFLRRASLSFSRALLR